MNNFNGSITLPHSGFCICKNKTLYVNNKNIIGFKINDKNAINDNCCLIMLTSCGNYQLLETTDISYEDFKKVANKIINRVLESLRFDYTSNINVDEIINEVIKYEN